MKTNAAVVGGGRFEPPEAAQVAGVWSTVSPANDWRVLAPRLCVMMFLVSMPSSTKYVLPIVSKATLLMTRRSARVRARSVSNLPERTGRPGADGAVQSGSMGVAHSEHRG